MELIIELTLRQPRPSLPPSGIGRRPGRSENTQTVMFPEVEGSARIGLDRRKRMSCHSSQGCYNISAVPFSLFQINKQKWSLRRNNREKRRDCVVNHWFSPFKACLKRYDFNYFNI